MIAKQRKIPIRIQIYEALLRRLPKNHPKRPEIEEDALKRQAGYKGEQALDFYLNLLPEKDYTIFHDLRLPYGNSHFQIDTLLLSSTFALILEVKNISGTLIFDRTFNQLIRITGDKEESFPDPLSQVYNQHYQFKNWMEKRKIPELPIEYLVVISNSSSIIKISGNSNIYRKICPVGDLLRRINEISKIYKSIIITQKEIRRISQFLLKNHSEPSYDITQIYGISKKEISTGVQCPSCFTMPMIRKHGTWECPLCQTRSKTAHVQALQDYFLLIDSSITNKQFRDFLHLHSINTANYLLSSMNLCTSGSTKSRLYHDNQQD
ncbi:nerd domain-containing protein [Bacillus methanolicus PB1]|uniref:Nerd domain-containing protein n=1 Tax=Bacillus methanolicus PB1 TaxID=997296 RepID=I3E2I1_BACMT|nr:nuclease-related domain-containing protein [Bacillus methanolicus]EIJ80702.1 nerd domain-containing protein [Bacillus methanolicus PB1]